MSLTIPKDLTDENMDAFLADPRLTPELLADFEKGLDEEIACLKLEMAEGAARIKAQEEEIATFRLANMALRTGASSGRAQ